MTFTRSIRLFGRRPASLNTGRCGVSFVLPTSTIVVGLVGTGSAAYAYGVGLRSGRATVSVQTTPPSKPKYGSPEEVHQAIKELQAALPSQIRKDPITVEAYGFSPHTYLPGSPHAVYVAATSTEDVIKVVNISRKYRVPVIPFGVGNSLEGQFTGASPFSLSSNRRPGLKPRTSIRQEASVSICQAWTKFSPSMVHDCHETAFVVLTIPLEEDGDLVCQAGARWDEINRILEEKGIPLFFPVCSNGSAVPRL